MDFFASQDLAKKNTRKLVVLLGITLIAITGSVYILILLALQLALRDQAGAFDSPAIYVHALLWTLLGVISVVSFGSLYKIMELRRGGQAVANMLQGRRLLPNSTDLAERRVLNIVEEMALASGVPVPPVYVLEHEEGINAFAAGHTVDDAVIGLNRGTIEQLNRDELQGVIAHEFSHILNGDMRMSLRLIGILHGIQVIALIGYFLIRTLGHGSHRRSSRDNKNDPTVFLLVAGVGLLVIGSVGLFFAKLIKASISRQREYLADASSVQFTRNPEGIAGALKMIAVNQHTSEVGTAHAQEISHMFFANMTGKLMSGMLSTHPPLPKRITAVEPRFDGDFEGYVRTRSTATIPGLEKEKEKQKTAIDLGCGDHWAWECLSLADCYRSQPR
ncbi:MAG: M48 family metallopeptidase [Pirellulaceae bacterium]